MFCWSKTKTYGVECKILMKFKGKPITSGKFPALTAGAAWAVPETPRARAFSPPPQKYLHGKT